MRLFLSAILSLLSFYGCQKQQQLVKNPVDAQPISDSFTTYTIKKGQQYCDNNSYTKVDYSELKFVVKFDSSAIYTTENPANQYDINKWYGFSDHNAAHHLFSARFGWRWSDRSLRIFAYVYNNGNNISKELGTVQIGDVNNCSIKVIDSHYIFSLNSSVDSMPRISNTATGEGYKLYPYFGGDETAPHDIIIKIEES